MLTMPAGSRNTARLVSIDPGSTTVGIAVIDINVDNWTIINSQAWTYNSAKMSESNTWLESQYGNRYVRIVAIENYLVNLFLNICPTLICSEAPFINQRFPAAGIALTEVMCSIRNAVVRYDPWCALKIIPPSSVKNGVGAKGNADKFAMKEALQRLLPELNYNGNIPFDLLDEHSIDALAVGYSEYKSYCPY